MINCLWFGLLFLLLFRNQTRPEQNTPFWGLGLGRTRTGSFVVLLMETQEVGGSVPRENFSGVWLPIYKVGIPVTAVLLRPRGCRFNWLFCFCFRTTRKNNLGTL
jgi:hypothetical protein